MMKNLPIKHLSSTENTRFKQLKKIANSSRERRKLGKTLLDGVHLVNSLADTGMQPELIIVADKKYTADNEIAACLARFPLVEVISLSQPLFNQISVVEHAVGILAVIAIPVSYIQRIKSPQCAVMLENIQDPGNLGSILRTAAAAGADVAYLSKGCAEAWSPKALRAGMGAHFAISMVQNADPVQCLRPFKTVLATSLNAKTQIYDLDLSMSVAFVFGNEGAGLSADLRAFATHQVKIPMLGNVESLNVAAAAAVCLYERVRQVQSRKPS